MVSRSIGRGLVAVAIVLGAAVDGGAQTSTGGLRGFVRDNSNLVMVGVTVEASSPARIGGPAVAVDRYTGRVHVHEPAGRRLHAGVHAAGLHDGPS